MTLICPLISSKVKCYKVNWKAIYDLLFHTNFGHTMHHQWDTTPWKVCDLDLTFKGNPRSKVTMSTERSYMTSYMYFIQTLVTACTVSEILALIDNKGINWTFLTLKITFITNQHHLKFENSTRITSEKLYDAIQLGSTSLLLINIEKYVKMSQTWPFWP